MNIDEYVDSLKGKRVAVVGIGVSNRPLIGMLASAGIDVTACDKITRQALGQAGDTLENLGAKLRLGEGYLDDLDQDIIFRSPGIRPDIPAFEKAKERGSAITSEMEVFFDVCPCPIIAVTGSDGKTTTTTIISELLRDAGRTAWLGGNIGHPLLADTPLMKPEHAVVLELSSFQLMTLKKSPHIAVVTNLAPNHLDVHRDMQEYIDAKMNIFTHQSAGDILVLNEDNGITRGFAPKAAGEVRLFSRRERVENGVYLKGGDIIRAKNGSETTVMTRDDILIPGDHNVENYMAAIAAVGDMVPDEVIRRTARTFKGVEHRIELVREKDGVRFYNDSIASSPSRTIAGLRSFKQKVILIAGGYDKHIPFDVLGPEVVEHVKAMVLTGDTAGKIRAAVEQAPGYEKEKLPIVTVDDFEQAVRTAAGMTQPGDIVTLSPACASFDRFRNFAERGDKFKEIINNI